MEPAAPDPTPVRCPVIAAPQPGPIDPAELDPLLGRLADPSPVRSTLTFPRGTLQPDGRLDLCKQSLGPAGAQRLLGAAFASPHPVHLLLGTNALGAEGASTLARLLTPGHPIRTLYLGCNHIEAGGAAALAQKLASDRTVQGLWLKRNPIGDDGVRALAAALATNQAVRTLDLTNTGVSLVGLRALAGALATRKVAMERLYLGGNGLGPEAAEVLAGPVRDGVVRELYLAAGQIGDDGARLLARALPGRQGLVLGLGGNGLGPDGIRALAAHLDSLAGLDLARPPSAQVLRAVPNTVGDDGASALAAALPGSRLRRLDLRHTGVTGRGARRLLEALTAGSELEQLGLGAGVPRRIKRAVGAHLRPPSAPASDIRAIASVYR